MTDRKLAEHLVDDVLFHFDVEPAVQMVHEAITQIRAEEREAVLSEVAQLIRIQQTLIKIVMDGESTTRNAYALQQLKILEEEIHRRIVVLRHPSGGETQTPSGRE